MMLRIRSSSTGVDVFSTGSRRWPAPSPSGILAQRRRRRRCSRARLRRLALDELLADHRLQADRALGVLAEVLEGRVVDLQHDRRLVVAASRRALDLADLRARDLHVLARDEEAALLKIARTLVVAAVVARRARAEHEHDEHGDQQQAAGQPRFMAGETLRSWAGQHVLGVAVEAAGRNGLEPSGRGWVAAPGQRRLSRS